MVRIALTLLVVALAISPALTAPIARERSAHEARDPTLLELDSREPVSALFTWGKKAFTAFAGPAGLGVAMAPLLWGKKDKRGRFDEDTLEARARSYQDALEARVITGLSDEPTYLVVRNEDGSYALYTREPLAGLAGILKMGSAALKSVGTSIRAAATSMKTLKAPIKAHSHWALPVIGAGGFVAGAYGRKNTLREYLDEVNMRNFHDEDLYGRAEQWDELD